MFHNFDSTLFDDPNFKEDSVREVIIVPILSRLGYHPTGIQTVVRSKGLVHPFIYVGTRHHPVTIIPDYTLNYEDKPILVLDAKHPNESVSSYANIQQAYSYAIHAEIHAKHFALCNGRRLAIYNVDRAEPLLDLPFEKFESHWKDIERYLLPKYLLQPGLRDYMPDFGYKISRLGMTRDNNIIMIGTRLSLFAQVNQNLYTATVSTELAGINHCVSFDFNREQLLLLVAGLPNELSGLFLDALSRAPFQAGADLAIEVDLKTHLGDSIKVQHETFVPLVIDEVVNSRFNATPPMSGGNDIPPHIFRLSHAFKIVSD
jgi:hypothetical protein